MHKTAPLDSLIETKSGRMNYAAPKRTSSSKTGRGIPARLFGLLLVSGFSAGAWYVIYRLVISLLHG